MLSLVKRLELSNALQQVVAGVVDNPSYTLDQKFDLLNMSLRTEPLGWCGMITQVAYKVTGLERITKNIVLVHFEDPQRLYQLPPRYARMVSCLDVALVNAGVDQFTLTRAIKRSNANRVRFDHKSYTWDLVLTRC